MMSMSRTVSSSYHCTHLGPFALASLWIREVLEEIPRDPLYRHRVGVGVQNALLCVYVYVCIICVSVCTCVCVCVYVHARARVYAYYILLCCGMQFLQQRARHHWYQAHTRKCPQSQSNYFADMFHLLRKCMIVCRYIYFASFADMYTPSFWQRVQHLQARTRKFPQYKTLLRICIIFADMCHLLQIYVYINIYYVYINVYLLRLYVVFL